MAATKTSTANVHHLAPSTKAEHDDASERVREACLLAHGLVLAIRHGLKEEIIDGGLYGQSLEQMAMEIADKLWMPTD